MFLLPNKLLLFSSTPIQESRKAMGQIPNEHELGTANRLQPSRTPVQETEIAGKTGGKV
jgi:hypothetical protein